MHCTSMNQPTISDEDYQTLYVFRIYVESVLEQAEKDKISRNAVEKKLYDEFPMNTDWVHIIIADWDMGVRLKDTVKK